MGDNPKLAQYRKRLDDVDRRILDAVADRQAIVEEVARLKSQDSKRLANTSARDRARTESQTKSRAKSRAKSRPKLRDLLREESQLSHLVALAREKNLSAYLVKRLFRELLDFSLSFQMHHVVDQDNPERGGKERLTIAFQGAPGAYSQIAAEQHFAAWEGEIECAGYPGFAAMLDAVNTGAADYAMLPVENTTAGSITESFDLLARMELCAVGEEVLRVEHCLVALPDVSLAQIRAIFSHPQALAQCSIFLSGLSQCTVQAFTDTAASVQKVADERDPSQAAIASERAAALYGLEVIARNLENQRGNYTRFMVIARNPLRFDERIACKTSLIFSTSHERGALVRCLNVLADRGLNLTKLESRPQPSSPFEYLFYVDFEGNVDNEAVQQALEDMRDHTHLLKVLGSYPSFRA